MAPVAVAAALATLALASCVARPQMCGGAGEASACSKSEGECVAGRCLPPNGGGLDGGGPEILATAPPVRRIVVAPTDVALVRRGDGALAGALPTALTLGREGEGDARLLMRFSVPLATRAKVVEAYVLLEVDGTVDADPAPVTLHLTRIVEPWDSRSVSWALQPATLPTKTAETRIANGGGARGLVRIAATPLVSAWRAHDPRDQGVAIVASTTSNTGITFASGASTPSTLSMSPLSAPFEAVESTRGGGPRLELYVK